MKNKKRKIDRKKLIYTFVFALFCVFGLTVAYAALSTTLNISGSAQVTSSEWGLKIERLQLTELDINLDSECSKEGVICYDNYVTIGSAELVGEPSIVDTTIKGLAVSTVKPGDSAILFYKVTNTGSIPAKLVSKEFNTPEFVSVYNNYDDVLWAENNFIYSDDIGILDVGDLQIGEVICPGDTYVLSILVMINENAENLPSGKIHISNLGSNYVFTQDKLTSCPT